MPFLRIVLDANSDELGRADKLRGLVDSANPSYRGKYPFIRCWLIEFDDDGAPWREIGLDQNEAIVVAGPSTHDYGFWLDTNMQYADFKGEPVAGEYFEKLWAESGVVTP